MVEGTLRFLSEHILPALGRPDFIGRRDLMTNHDLNLQHLRQRGIRPLSFQDFMAYLSYHLLLQQTVFSDAFPLRPLGGNYFRLYGSQFISKGHVVLCNCSENGLKDKLQLGFFNIPIDYPFFSNACVNFFRDEVTGQLLSLRELKNKGSRAKRVDKIRYWPVTARGLIRNGHERIAYIMTV